MAKFRLDHYINNDQVPRTSAEAQGIIASLDDQLARWRSSCPPEPSALGAMFVNGLRMAGSASPSGFTMEAIAANGTRAYATAVQRWGPHGSWGEVPAPTGKAMLQSTALLLVMAGGSYFFMNGPEVPLAFVVIAVFTACFGFVRLSQQKTAAQIAVDAVHHYETWKKEIEKLSGERAALDDLREALAEMEEWRELPEAIAAWEERFVLAPARRSWALHVGSVLRYVCSVRFTTGVISRFGSCLQSACSQPNAYWFDRERREALRAAGLAAAKLLAQEGAQVVIGGRDVDKAKGVIAESGGRITARGSTGERPSPTTPRPSSRTLRVVASIAPCASRASARPTRSASSAGSRRRTRAAPAGTERSPTRRRNRSASRRSVRRPRRTTAARDGARRQARGRLRP